MNFYCVINERKMDQSNFVYSMYAQKSKKYFVYIPLLMLGLYFSCRRKKRPLKGKLLTFYEDSELSTYSVHLQIKMTMTIHRTNYSTSTFYLKSAQQFITEVLLFILAMPLFLKISDFKVHI